MMSHYITKIHIDQVRHLQNLDIELFPDKRSHLILTGKNGSGKTSLLNSIKTNLASISNGERNKALAYYPQRIAELKKRCEQENRPKDQIKKDENQLTWLEKKLNTATAGISLYFNTEDGLVTDFQEGAFITACFPANRLTQISAPHGVEDVKLQTHYNVEQQPVMELIKYLVHLKTQQAYAKNENDHDVEERIANWFSTFEKAIQTLVEDDSISLTYDYKNYNFLIHQSGRNPFGFNQLSDGYSAAIYILSDLLMRMDQGWLQKGTVLDKSAEGVVLIDEVETHLHLALQKSILPFLTEMFPNLQFIVTTHSPFVVNSLEDAVIYDLETKTMVRHGLSNVSYEGIVEGYFQTDTLSAVLRQKFERYKSLILKPALTDDDYDEIMSLEQYLDEIPDYLSIGIAEEYGRLKLEFQTREDMQ